MCRMNEPRHWMLLAIAKQIDDIHLNIDRSVKSPKKKDL